MTTDTPFDAANYAAVLTLSELLASEEVGRKPIGKKAMAAERRRRAKRRSKAALEASGMELTKRGAAPAPESWTRIEIVPPRPDPAEKLVQIIEAIRQLTPAVTLEDVHAAIERRLAETKRTPDKELDALAGSNVVRPSRFRFGLERPLAVRSDGCGVRPKRQLPPQLRSAPARAG
jgi:hypothetical protein